MNIQSHTQSAASLRIEKLSPTIGAEISGIDLRHLPSDEMLSQIKTALLEHKVIFFRDQDITPAQHIAFAKCFGDLEIHPLTPKDQEHPEVLHIAHGPDSKGRENAWHSDVTWRPKPSLGSILRAVEVPDVGGDTLFCDMYAAFDGLPDDMKDKVCGLTAFHDYMKNFGRLYPKEKHPEIRARHPSQEHPVVRTHPETGRNGLYVNVGFTDHIKGMEKEESDELLDYLYRRASIPEYQCRFRWKKNSIAFWDNRACQHYAASDYFPQVRKMQRVTIAGDRPFFRE